MLDSQWNREAHNYFPSHDLYTKEQLLGNLKSLRTLLCQARY